MITNEISALARQLYATQGARAIAEAAQNAERCTQRGDDEEARLWQRVESVLREMRGPIQT